MQASGACDAASLAESELRMPARSSELGVARQYAADAATAFGLDADDCYDFVVAANEAVTNAIRHGAPDEQGLIHLSTVADADRLMFAVRDCGTFVMPARNGAMSSEHGRGLALMAGLVDEVLLEIGPAGTNIRLSKARS
jgi:serine/threonine-protein kinase RsbW